MIAVIGKQLHQWELRRYVLFTPQYGENITELHFAHKGDVEALVMKAVADGDGYKAQIPNELLTSSKSICVYAVRSDDNGRETVESKVLPVYEQEKPADYVYTPTEVLSYRTLAERATNAAEEAAKSAAEAQKVVAAYEAGELKGEPGPQGPQGEPGDPAEGSVLYTEQELTFDQKRQARGNIGALGEDDKDALSDEMDDNYVSYTRDQVLDEEQQMYACRNIQAVPSRHFSQKIAEIEAAMVDKFCPAFTETAPAVRCEPVEGYPLGVVSQILPVQEGSGNPYPHGGGKNLIDVSKLQYGYDLGSNEIRPMDGWYVTDFIPVLPSTAYALSGTSSSYKFEYRADKTLIVEAIGGAYSFTTTAETRYVIANSLIEGYDKPQLELGATATEYAPYSNIRPITGWTGAKLWRGGKNLLKLSGREVSADNTFSNTSKRICNGNSIFLGLAASNYKNSGIINSYEIEETSVTYTSGANAYGIGFDLLVKPGETYTFSCKEIVTFGIAYYAEDGTHISYSSSRTNRSVQTVPENAKWLVVVLSCNLDDVNTEITCSDIQIEKGDTATSFEPCREGKEFTLDFGQTVYGGSLDWKTGVLTITKAGHVVDGTEAWTYTESPGPRCYFRSEPTSKLSGDGLCSHARYCGLDVGSTIAQVFNYGNQVTLNFPNLSTLEQYVEYFQQQLEAGTPVTVIWPLAEPITIQLTPQEILALSGVNALYSDTGDTTVTGRADPRPMLEAQKTILERLAALEAAAVNNT